MRQTQGAPKAPWRLPRVEIEELAALRAWYPRPSSTRLGRLELAHGAAGPPVRDPSRPLLRDGLDDQAVRAIRTARALRPG